MKAETRSVMSNETATLRKLGVDTVDDNKQNLATVINRIRTGNTFVSVVMIVIQFIQYLIIGLAPTIEGFMKNIPNINFLNQLFLYILHPALQTNQVKNVNFYVLIIIGVIDVIWFVFYLAFSFQFEHYKTFSKFVVFSIYIIGDFVLRILSMTVMSTFAYFLRSLYADSSIETSYSLFSVVILIITMAIQFYTVNLVLSSPDVDIKNLYSMWPEETFDFVYRTGLLYVLPFIIELFRDTSVPLIVPYIITMLFSIGGIVFNQMRNVFIFPKGRALVFTQYSMLLLSSLFSIIYHYANGNQFIYLVLLIVLVIVIFFVADIILNRLNRKSVDILYMKFDDLIENIESPEQCKSIVRIGLIYNAPCILNHTILNWAISRWPLEQDLLLVIAYIYYIMNVPYRDILDIVINAVEIQPFNKKQLLFFYQIFKRLPTHEAKLTKRLESIRRMYSIPKASLHSFWECIIQRQWDEAVTRCYNFADDLDKLNQIFSSLIFDNPSSDSVMQEFIKFADTIQGNHILATKAQNELNRRLNAKQAEEEIQNQLASQTASQNGSQVQLSRLSSLKSSAYLSDFSEAVAASDRINNNLQTAFNVRPLFWPKFFLITTAFIALFSFVGVVVVYAISYETSDSLKKRVEISRMIHVMAQELAESLSESMLFPSHADSAENSITGEVIDLAGTRQDVSTLSQQFDADLSTSFGMYSHMPDSFMRTWVSQSVLTADADATITADTLSDMTIYHNLSLVTAVRIFQVRVMTLAYTPADSLGSPQDPSPDAILVGFLYPSVAQVTKYLDHEVVNEIKSDSDDNFLIIVILALAFILASLIICLISCPIIIIGFIREYDFLVSLIQSIPSKSAYKMLALDDKKANISVEDRIETSSKKINSGFYGYCKMIWIFFLVFIITPLPVIIIIISYMQYQDGIIFIAHALELSSQFVAEFGHLILYGYRIVSGFPSPYTLEEEIKLFNDSAQSTTNKYRELFFGGTDNFPDGLIKMYPDLMERISVQKCNVIAGGGSLNVNCMSFHDMIYFLFDEISRICSITSETFPNSFNTNWWRHFYPVAYASLTTGIPEYFNVLSDIVEDLNSSHTMLTSISIALGVVLFVLALIICYTYMKFSMEPHMRCILKPLMVMPPEIISECPMLLRFLQGDYDQSNRAAAREKNRKSNSKDTKPLIDFISEGVLVVNTDGTIIASNRVYHEFMNNTAEEVLGQNIRSILPQSVQSLFDVLDNVKSGNNVQQSTTIETMLFTEDDRELQVRITLIVQPTEHGKTPTCAFIIYDRSDLIKAQALLRKEKANVESLLDSILPHNIAVSLLNGQSDISFEAELGLVLFSDLVSFTPMCSKMSAKQIMTVLNLLFTNFDNELAKFKRVTKLKTIGDAYVCATGIFEGDGPLEDAASEIVQFGITMQKIIPQLNKQHNLSLRQRVGIHCGGPLICGVLGKEKPLFEVIGATVDLAEELEATCLPEKVHISQPVVDLLGESHLHLTERTGVEVHGVEGRTYTIEV